MFTYTRPYHTREVQGRTHPIFTRRFGYISRRHQTGVTTITGRFTVGVFVVGDHTHGSHLAVLRQNRNVVGVHNVVYTRVGYHLHLYHVHDQVTS